MKQDGFTLIEVLVALIVAALALLALTYGASLYVLFQQQLQERIQAQRVAANTWIRIHALKPEPLMLTETVNAEGRFWRVQMKLEPTPLQGFQRISLSVSPQDREDEVLATLVSVWHAPAH